MWLSLRCSLENTENYVDENARAHIHQDGKAENL
jgi:hypothetical protein